MLVRFFHSMDYELCVMRYELWTNFTNNEVLILAEMYLDT